MNKQPEDVLMHYGIKGMKWGVRKGSSSKSASSMSDEELKKRVNRMNLEQRYSDLSSKKKSKGAKVAALALGAIGGLGARGVKKLAFKAVDVGVEKIIEKVAK